jgi:phage/plasmid-associated DNA primase
MVKSQHPHWDLVLDHCGGSLKAGREYLQSWIAAMLRDPFKQLPYLFLYGPQNNGKSTFHEAIALLLDDPHSVINADRLLSGTYFNQELAHAVLCIVEETDLQDLTDCSDLKAWVTSPMLTIFEMRKQVRTQRNRTHWIQCAAMEADKPNFLESTLVTLYVPPLDKEIPRQTLLPALLAEIQQFRKTLGTRVALV